MTLEGLCLLCAGDGGGVVRQDLHYHWEELTVARFVF